MSAFQKKMVAKVIGKVFLFLKSLGSISFFLRNMILKKYLFSLYTVPLARLKDGSISSRRSIEHCSSLGFFIIQVGPAFKVCPIYCSGSYRTFKTSIISNSYISQPTVWGGLVARSFIMDHGARFPYVKLFISLATPWGGDEMAEYGVKQSPSVIPCWIDMQPGSPFSYHYTKQKCPRP